MIVPSLRSGGTERVASLLCDEWMRQGNEVLLCLFDGEEAFFKPQVRQVSLAVPAAVSVSKKFSNFVKRVLRLYKLMRLYKPTHVIAFSEMASFPAIAAAIFSGNISRTIVSVRANPARRSRVARCVTRFFFAFPYRIVGASKGVGDALVELVSTDPERTTAIPNPVSMNRPEVGVAGWGNPSILAVGRMVRPKRFDILVEAFARVQKDSAGARLRVLGDGEEHSKLVEQVATLGLNEKIEFPGTTRVVADHLVACDIFVLSSESEGWPNALAEALCVGCAVVATDCPFGPNEMIVDGESGLLVPVNDPAALAAAISRLITDPELRQRLSRGALERAKLWTLESTARRWLDLKQDF